MCATRALVMACPAILSSRKRASASTSGNSGTGGTEPAFAALMIVEGIDADELGLRDRLHDELGDPVTAANREGIGRIGVDQQHPQFAAVAAVDQPGRVETRHPVVQCQDRK